MNKVFKASLVALTTIFGLSSTAQAGIFDFDPAEGNFYVSGFGGIVFPFDAELEGVDADLDNAAYFGGAIGARLPFKYWKYFQPRLELEVSRYNADFAGGDFGGLTGSGDQSATFFLINNNSEIIWDENQRIVPYFGGGIGFADYDTEVSFTDGALTESASSSDTGFATLSTLGANFKATEQFDVYVEGRYLRTYGVNEDLEGDLGVVDVDGDPEGFTITAGVRFNF